MIKFETTKDGVCSLGIAGTLEQIAKDCFTFIEAIRQSVTKQQGVETATEFVEMVTACMTDVYSKPKAKPKAGVSIEALATQILGYSLEKAEKTINELNEETKNSVVAEIWKQYHAK